ncbi:MAG: adenylyltransferase/cytidyltransferase family protein [Bacteroidota bacterium]|nr:adenylyltransferase/cytidyltransferase family protein [Bacteroidota bacterium]
MEIQSMENKKNIKVITYGTYDLLHFGHVRLLERAKALGDYLIVGVTADGFDKARGKINVQQSLMERIESVKQTGLADEIIVEEYEGQKIDDIKRLNVDIFAIGSDWKGKFDYLSEFCQVVYLERTAGVSSSELRAERTELGLGLVGEIPMLDKYEKESHYVNGLKISGAFGEYDDFYSPLLKSLRTQSFEQLVEVSDALYIASHPKEHYNQILYALENKKHVLCKSPIAIDLKEWQELKDLAKENSCVLFDSIKTGYALAYYRLLLLVKSGIIGEVISVDATCTSFQDMQQREGKDFSKAWNSISAWGPTAMLPVFQILGTKYKAKTITSHFAENIKDFDLFTKISYIFPHSVASIKVGKGVKSEGELIISGTKGYIYVPAPWWKTEYFEVRKENLAENKRYFYQLDGEGIRYELISFVKAITLKEKNIYIDDEVSRAIAKEIEDFYTKSNLIEI